MRIVQIFNAEKQEMSKFKEINKEYTQANLNSIFYYAVFFPVVEFISALALALMIWLGAKAYLADTVSFGAMVAFPIYLNLLFRPVRFVGSTGSGKSSIINILNRFYEFQSGSISIDGTDIRKYELLSLRQRISIVLQDVFLFNGNVTDNITLRDENISLEKVKEAAKTIGTTANFICASFSLRS